MKIHLLLASLVLFASACERPPEIAPHAGANETRPSAMIAEFSDLRVPAEMVAGKTYRASVAVKNAGAAPWAALGPSGTPSRAFRLAYHWYRADGTVYKPGERTNLPKNIEPGETIRLDDVTILAPSDPGSYMIEFDMLQEMVRWFNVPSARIPVTVR